MKTLIVQGFCRCDQADWTQFWQPCVRTVQRWAEANQFDYQFYDTPLHTLTVDDKINHSLSEFSLNQYYKFQWCDHPEYDRVCWIDADTIVWGNPQFLDDTWFCAGERWGWQNGKRDHLAQFMRGKPWVRPTLSLFWGRGDAMHDLHSWFQTTLSDPTQRGEILSTTISTFNKDETAKDLITEEIYCAEWVELNRSNIQLIEIAEHGKLSQSQQFYYNWPWYVPTPNSLVHFPGPDKKSSIMRFLTYRLSVEDSRFTVASLLKTLDS